RRSCPPSRACRCTPWRTCRPWVLSPAPALRLRSGRRRARPSAPGRRARWRRRVELSWCALLLLTGDDEGENEPEQGQGPGEGDAEEHRRAGHARGFGLAGHGRDGVADDDADADTRPDGGPAVDDASAHG